MIKRIFILLVFAISCHGFAHASGPPVTQSPDWVYIVNNAFRTADEYAVAHNPSAVFACAKKDYEFVKQIAGKYKGKYLLIIRCKHAGNISFAVLLPNFDVTTTADKLNDEDPTLWKVVNAKLNGKEF